MIDVIIIGAGPAGLSAAIVCAENGLQVKVIDEFMKPGGRLLGQLHQEPTGEWWNGIEEAKNMYNRAVSLSVDITLGTSVYDVQPSNSGWRVYTSEEILETNTLLIATGAAEVAAPMPGWTLPGVMSIGAAQVMTNVHRVRVGKRGIIVGVNVLSVAIARELQLADIEIVGMMLPPQNTVNKDAASPEKVMQSLLRVAHLAPSAILRLGSKLMKFKLFQRLGLAFYPSGLLKMWGIPIHLKRAVIEICGENQVESVKVAYVTASGEVVPGTTRIAPVDFVCIAGDLYPLAELASVAGCPLRYVPELGGHVPLHDTNMQTPLEGLYVAGNITGIESAKVAKAQGKVAGLAIVQSFKPKHPMVQKELDQAKQQVIDIREQALIQFHPQVAEGRERIARMASNSEVGQGVI
ncbi:NAD(P)/FAD-dependent oxidoreductase [Paenibacillus sp. N1-5-1-14]|uniref:NAD(P)/FAD-dependent oxidoreductase n=1 Tax=Paenibacillus radicibacter TaxID=2972488 RepID=UPI0021595958|nr:NAD(P)/FAD-dependent oxidoreductase [Paenibacillus radicibacter]MCR8644789.1 NAD(P)/FAD-dependent oxidoreductase [Paenibacillus radicibacter]